MTETKIQGRIVKEYLAKFPDTPSVTLAKKIYKENKTIWETWDSIRSSIRYYRGQNGKRHRIEITDKTYFKPVGKDCPFDSLPEGLTELKDYKPFQITGSRILAFADPHIPYYVKRELGVTIGYGKAMGIDTVLIGGDFIDFYSLSFWQNDPRRRDIANELRTAWTVLDYIRQTFPKAQIVYIRGNHEERLERYLRVKAPELLGYEALELEKMIKAEDYGVDVVPSRHIVKIGKYLHVLHGHEFGRFISTPVNPARTLYLKGKEIAMCFHYHQTSEHNEKSMAEKNIACWSVGGLCDMHPEYMPINKWNYGFAYIEREGDSFQVENKRIINGKIY